MPRDRRAEQSAPPATLCAAVEAPRLARLAAGVAGVAGLAAAGLVARLAGLAVTAGDMTGVLDMAGVLRMFGMFGTAGTFGVAGMLLIAATVAAVTGLPPQHPLAGDAAPCIRNSPASTAHTATALPGHRRRARHAYRPRAMNRPGCRAGGR